MVTLAAPVPPVGAPVAADVVAAALVVVADVVFASVDESSFEQPTAPTIKIATAPTALNSWTLIGFSFVFRPVEAEPKPP